MRGLGSVYSPGARWIAGSVARITANLTGDLCDGYELDERGRVVRNQQPSGRRQIAATDIYCQVTEQLGHLAGMSVAVTTPFSGIRVPDVVWLPPGTCEGFDYSHPLPVVPDLCAEVLPDSLAMHDVDRRVNAYLAGGAREVIVVDRYGRVYFWGDKGPRQTSVFGLRLLLDPVCCTSS